MINQTDYTVVDQTKLRSSQWTPQCFSDDQVPKKRYFYNNTSTKSRSNNIFITVFIMINQCDDLYLMTYCELNMHLDCILSFADVTHLPTLITLSHLLFIGRQQGQSFVEWNMSNRLRIVQLNATININIATLVIHLQWSCKMCAISVDLIYYVKTEGITTT